jgi:type 2A phosphatase activator TIP41
MEHGQCQDWSFSSCRSHISLSTDIDELGKQVGFVPPEQLYLDNRLEFKFKDTQFKIEFSAADALRTVLPSDWTFMPRNYFGKFEKDQVVVNPVENESVEMDMELLSRKDPIVFYSNVVLFEDELHDHGHCTLSVKTVRLIVFFKDI